MFRRGEFVVEPYRVYIDFNKCDGITKIVWRGKVDDHVTLTSKLKERFTRVGSSVQISNKLVRAIEKSKSMKGLGNSLLLCGVTHLYDEHSLK